MNAYTFPTATPESLGIPSKAVSDMLDAIRREGVTLNSIQIIRYGKRCVEGYYAPYGPEDPHVCFSFTKSITATAIGLLQSEGKISLEDKVISFFPEDLPEEISENLAEMNIRHLLTMTCGHETEPRCRNDYNWVKGFLAHPVKRKPGTFFVYNSVGSYMLTAILRKVTGLNLTEYLKPRLFDKMGIEKVSCSKCPMGTEHGGGGMRMRPADMAKMAQLWLNRGVWEGETLVDPAFIDEATGIHIVQAEGWNPVKYPGMEDYFSGYGYQNWRNTVPGSYRFDGMYGQLAMILPKYDMIVLTTSATLRIYKILNTVWRMLIPALEAQALPEDEAAQKALEEYLGRLSVDWTETGCRVPGNEALIEGRRILLPPNDCGILAPMGVKKGLESLKFSFGDNTAALTLVQNGAEETVTLGLDGARVRSVLGGEEIASTANWTDENTLVLDLNQVNHVFHQTVTLKFGEFRQVDVTLYLTPNDCDIPTGSRYRPALTLKGTLE